MFMLDTNAFNRVLDGQIDPETLNRRGRLYATHVQLDELTKTKNAERQILLLATFRAIDQEQIPTEGAAWNVSRWGEAKWDADDSLNAKIFARLNQANRSKGNNMQDSLIASTAVTHGYTLVTDDRDLATVAREFGGTVETFRDFESKLREAT